MITTTVLLGVPLWHSGKRVGAIVFTVLFLAIQAMFFIAAMAKFLHGGWCTRLLTAAILFVMYTWNEGTKLERAQRRHMRPNDFLPALDKLHSDFRIPYFADNIVYLPSDSETKRLDTDIFFSIFAEFFAGVFFRGFFFAFLYFPWGVGVLLGLDFIRLTLRVLLVFAQQRGNFIWKQLFKLANAAAFYKYRSLERRYAAFCRLGVFKHLYRAFRPLVFSHSKLVYLGVFPDENRLVAFAVGKVVANFLVVPVGREAKLSHRAEHEEARH